MVTLYIPMVRPNQQTQLSFIKMAKGRPTDHSGAESFFLPK